MVSGTITGRVRRIIKSMPFARRAVRFFTRSTELRAALEKKEEQIATLRVALQKKVRQVEELRTLTGALQRSASEGPTVDARRFHPAADGVRLGDALTYNTLTVMDTIYATESVVDRYNSPLQLSVYQLFLEALAANVRVKCGKVLDAGCGLGVFTNIMRQAFSPAEIWGSDFSNEAIKSASSRWPGIGFFVHDLDRHLADKYDLITCLETLEHLRDPELAVRNMLAGLEPGGILFLTVPDGRLDQSWRHVNFWSPESWQAFLERAAPLGWCVRTGVIQHQEAPSLRYNWAALSSSTCWKV